MNDSTPEALFESHLELALKIGRSFPIPNAAIDESEQEARIALWRAASSYDPAKGEFAGFASIVVRNHLRNVFNTAKRRGVEITALDASSSCEPEAEIDSAKNSLVSSGASPLLEAERASIRLVLQTQLASLTEAQQQLLKSYADGESYADISRRTGVSKALWGAMLVRWEIYTVQRIWSEMRSNLMQNTNFSQSMTLIRRGGRVFLVNEKLHTRSTL